MPCRCPIDINPIEVYPIEAYLIGKGVVEVSGCHRIYTYINTFTHLHLYLREKEILYLILNFFLVVCLFSCTRKRNRIPNTVPVPKSPNEYGSDRFRLRNPGQKFVRIFETYKPIGRKWLFHKNIAACTSHLRKLCTVRTTVIKSIYEGRVKTNNE